MSLYATSSAEVRSASERLEAEHMGSEHHNFTDSFKEYDRLGAGFFANFLCKLFNSTFGSDESVTLRLMMELRRFLRLSIHPPPTARQDMVQEHAEAAETSLRAALSAKNVARLAEVRRIGTVLLAWSSWAIQIFILRKLRR